MNTNTTALRVITLADGRRVKEVPDVHACWGCMFDDLSVGCERPDEQSELEGCCKRGTIYQPADPEPAAVAETTESGRPAWCPGCRPDVCPGCGPYKYERAAAVAETVKREPLTDEQIDGMVATATLGERDVFRRFARAIERSHGIGGREGGWV